MGFQQSPESRGFGEPIGNPQLETRKGFDMQRARTGGLAITAYELGFTPQELGLDTLGTQPTAPDVGQPGCSVIAGIINDPQGTFGQPWNIGDKGFRTTSSPDSTFGATSPTALPEGVVTMSGNNNGGLTDRFGVPFEYDRKSGNMTKESRERFLSDQRVREDESSSRGRTSRDDMRSGAATQTDDGRRSRNTRNDKSRSERRQVVDAGDAHVRAQIASWDRFGRPLDRNGNRIKGI